MPRARSNKPLLLLLGIVLVALAALGVFGLRRALAPVEARRGPTVAATLPVGEQSVSRMTMVELLFDQKMDHAATEAALTVEPAFTYQAEWRDEGAGERLILRPSGALAWGTAYRVILGEGAQNRAGLALAESATLAFTTGGEVRVAGVQPEPGSGSVAPGQAITVRFDRPLLDEANLADQEGLPQPIVLEPAVPGTGRWLAPDLYGFYPEGGLAAGATYRVILNPAVAPAAELAEPFGWQFTTEGPRVRASYPFNDASEVERATTVTLLFTEPMDHPSVESSFRLRPEEGGDPLAGRFVWEGDQTLIFEPSEPLDLATRYQVEISDAARAEGGSKGLGAPYRAVFATVDFLSVESVQPAPDSAEVSAVPTDTLISLQFNHPVVPLVGLVAKENLPLPLTITPNLPGTGEWLTTSLFVYRPSAPLSPSTEYVVTVEPSLQDTLGSFMAEPFQWSFATEFPRVVRVEPSNPHRLVAPEGPVALRFNQAMERASTEAAFALQDAAGTPVPGRFAWAEGDTLLRFTPATPLTREAEYTVALAVGARGARGGTTDKAFSARVVAAPRLRVTRVTPSDGSEEASPYDSIQVRFNTPITTTGLVDQLTFFPTVTQVYTYYDAEALTLNLSPSGPLQPSTRYTVTLGAGILDESGQPLGEPYTFGFTTAALSPMLGLVGPGPLVATYNPYTATLQLIEHRNVSVLEWELYQLSLDDLTLFLGPQAWERWDTFEPDPAARVASWQVPVESSLNLTSLYKTRLLPEGNSTLQTTLDAPPTEGIFLLRVRAPEEVNGEPLQVQQLMVFTPVNLTLKRAADEVLVWATDLQTGEPVAGLPVQLRAASGETVGEGETDADGLLRAPLTLTGPDADPYAPFVALSLTDGAVSGVVSTEWDSGIAAYEWDIATSYLPQALYGTIYSDRPLYRPGHTVHFRGVLRQRDGSQFIQPTLDTLTLTISYQGESRETHAVQLSPFGTFAGEFVLDEEAETGYYELNISQDQFGYCYGRERSDCYFETLYGSFQVAEYERPEFEVQAEWERAATVQGDRANATVQARYFFGGALPDAPFRWRLLSRDYAFPTPTGLSGYWTWQDEDDLFRMEEGESLSGVVREGTGTLDEAGRATVTLPTAVEGRDGAPRSQILTWEADVQDVNARTVTGRAALVAHAGEFYIGLHTDAYVGSAGTPFTITLATADTGGALLEEQEVAVEIFQREWYSIQEQREGGFVWTTSFTDTLVATRPAVTGANGQTTVSFTPEQGGSYTVLATATDSRGNDIRSRTGFWVSDDAFVAWGRDNDDRIELVADREQYRVGDVARILVPTPFGGMQALITEEQTGIGGATVRTLAGSAEVLEIPITEEMIPNVVISVVAATGMGEQTPLPEFRVGNVDLQVVPTEQTLTVEVTTANPDTLEPGGEASVALRVMDAVGDPVAAELSLAVVDKAILSLSEAQALSLVDTFYAPRPLGVRTASSFVVNVDRLSQDLAAEAKGGGGPGRANYGPEQVRGNFQDTAFWQADIVTDADGRAEVTFPLPDNLTTWVLTAQAVTAAGDAQGTLVGAGREEVLTTRPLLVRPALPRFLVVGDKADLQVPVTNNTPRDVTATVTFQATGVVLREGAEATQEITVPAGGSVVVTFPVEVSTSADGNVATDTATITIRAEGDGLSDGVERTLPIFPLSAPETVATGGLIREGEGAAVETIRLPEGIDPTQGELTLEMAPSLAGATRSALGWLEDYDFPSVEWTVSYLLPNIATKRALDTMGGEAPTWAASVDAEISTATQRLVTWQNSDGGWGWWRGDESQPWLSAYALLGLHEANALGFEVPEERLARATRFLERWLSRTAEIQSDGTLNTRAFVLYVLSTTGAGDASRAAALFDQHTLLNNAGRAFLLLALDNAGEAQRPQVQTLASELTARAILSATGAHWEEPTPNPETLDSSLRTTAVVLRALVRVEPEHLLVPQTVRWLMHARENGYWESTQATAWSLWALSDFMVASGELEADFAYTVALNDEVLLEEQATPDNLTEPVLLRVAVARLLRDGDNRLILTRTPPADGQGGTGRLYYSAWLRAYLPAEALPARFEGVSVARQYEAVDPATLQGTGARVDMVAVGDVIEVRLTVQAPNDLTFFTLEDPIPAGFEVVDPALLTTSQAAAGPTQERTDTPRSPFWYDGWSESLIRDEKVALFSDRLPRGTYEYTYLLRATTPGTFRALPAHAYEQFHPEVFGRSEGAVVEVE